MGRLKAAPDVRPAVRAAFDRWLPERSPRLKEFTPAGRLLDAFNAGWLAAQSPGWDKVVEALPDGTPRTFVREHDSAEQERMLSQNVGKH